MVELVAVDFSYWALVAVAADPAAYSSLVAPEHLVAVDQRIAYSAALEHCLEAVAEFNEFY